MALQINKYVNQLRTNRTVYFGIMSISLDIKGLIGFKVGCYIDKIAFDTNIDDTLEDPITYTIQYTAEQKDIKAICLDYLLTLNEFKDAIKL